MSSRSVKWLHLSDFHVGKDNYGQRKMFKYILDELKRRSARSFCPDLVFITGDIANKGLPAEYALFYTDFFEPLVVDHLDGDYTRVIIVPGNHDVNRTEAEAVDYHSVSQRISTYLDPTEEGLKKRQVAFGRLGAFVKKDQSVDSEPHWLFSTHGVLVRKTQIRGIDVGIAALNSAWLSCDDDDRGHLSVGKALLEDGLDRIKEQEIRIVVAHHPLDWLNEQERHPVRALFEQHGVIYLHGHLHRSEMAPNATPFSKFLCLQAGASFQSREEEIWPNRIVWSDLDLQDSFLCVEPLFWSKNHQEWKLDVDAFSNNFIKGSHFFVPLPWCSVPPRDQRMTRPTGAGNDITPSDGSVIITREYLAARKRDLAPHEILQFFDGRVPRWSEAMSPRIPRRDVVHRLLGHVQSATERQHAQITLLLGAGGEGKSTALRQVVCTVVNDFDAWSVVWQRNPSMSLPRCSDLPPGRNWLIVSDEADQIAPNVLALAKEIHELARSDIQFLLSCRDTDWIAAKANQYPWQHYIGFVEERLRGLSANDAHQIVAAWSNYGKDGLGHLYGLDMSRAEETLLASAKSEAASREGAFLGAMLRARLGEDLSVHVMTLLKRLNDRKACRGSLLDAFSYIVAMHAENQLFLSRDILQAVVGCTPGNLKRSVLGPLGEEAAATLTGKYVLTRHRAIAEAAMKIMAQDFCYDFDETFRTMHRAFWELYRSGSARDAQHEWLLLPRHFFESGKTALAVDLADAAVSLSGHHAETLMEYARFLRSTGFVEDSVDVFRRAPAPLQKPDRYLIEWARCHRANDEPAVSALLLACSLSDTFNKGTQYVDSAPTSLPEMGGLFRGLHSECRQTMTVAAQEMARSYRDAWGAAMQLAKQCGPGPSTEEGIVNSMAYAIHEGYVLRDASVAVRELVLGVHTACAQITYQPPQWLPTIDSLTFGSLLRTCASRNPG